MKIALIVSLLVTSLALNAQTLQGKFVRVADGDTITILDEAKGQSNGSNETHTKNGETR